MGLDVVKTATERLGGTVAVATRPGEGTRFTMQLPLATAIIQTLMVSVGEHIFAIPSDIVLETLDVKPGDVRPVGKEKVLLKSWNDSTTEAKNWNKMYGKNWAAGESSAKRDGQTESVRGKNSSGGGNEQKGEGGSAGRTKRAGQGQGGQQASGGGGGVHPSPGNGSGGSAGGQQAQVAAGDGQLRRR